MGFAASARSGIARKRLFGESQNAGGEILFLRSLGQPLDHAGDRERLVGRERRPNGVGLEVLQLRTHAMRVEMVVENGAASVAALRA